MAVDSDLISALNEEMKKKSLEVESETEKLLKAEEQFQSEEKNIQKQEHIFEKTKGIRLSDYSQRLKTLTNEETARQADQIIAARQALEARRNQIGLHKRQLEDQHKKLEKLKSELREKEAEFEVERRLIENLFNCGKE